MSENVPISVWAMLFGCLMVVASVLGTILALSAGTIADSVGVELLPIGGPNMSPWQFPILAITIGIWLAVVGGLWVGARVWMKGSTEEALGRL